MRFVAFDTVKNAATTTAAAFATCATWLVGMLAIMASQGAEQAHAYQPFLLA